MQTPDLACTHTSLETWHAHTPLLRHGMQTRLFVKYTHPLSNTHILQDTCLYTHHFGQLVLDTSFWTACPFWTVGDVRTRVHTHTYTHTRTHAQTQAQRQTQTQMQTHSTPTRQRETDRDRERQRETDREAGRRERGLSLGRREMEQ